MQNFGKIKTVFNNLLVEGLVTKDTKKKELFKIYVKTIKESEILKTQFLIYNNIEKKIESDPVSANIYVTENIKLLEKYSVDKIIAENNKLANLIKNDVKLNEDYDLVKLHESITNLITTKKTPKNIDLITKETKNVIDYITTNKLTEIQESVELPISMLSSLMAEKYNEKYSSIDETEKNILRVILQSTPEERVNQYKQMIGECLSVIEQLVLSVDKEAKDKLLIVKDKLNEDVEINDNNFISKLTKIIELKDNLKNSIL
jgi:hypothetical protein